MAAGVAIGSSIQYHLADKIFKLNPNTRKLSPVVNSRLSLDLAIQKVQEEFDNYNPVNEKDEEQSFSGTEKQYHNRFHSLQKLQVLGVKNNVVAENVLSFHDDRLLLPIIGRSDLEFQQDLSFAIPIILAFLSPCWKSKQVTIDLLD